MKCCPSWYSITYCRYHFDDYYYNIGEQMSLYTGQLWHFSFYTCSAVFPPLYCHFMLMKARDLVQISMVNNSRPLSRQCLLQWNIYKTYWGHVIKHTTATTRLPSIDWYYQTESCPDCMCVTQKPGVCMHVVWLSPDGSPAHYSCYSHAKLMPIVCFCTWFCMWVKC